VPDQAGRLPRMVHVTCGEQSRPVLGCAGCRAPVEPRDVAGGFGPSGTWQRSVPVSTTRRRSGVAELFPQAMVLLGNRRSAAMLGAAFLGACRFTDFERWLGAPPTVVADRLRTFGDLGVLAPAPGDRTDRVSYRLTAKGRAFFPVVMVDWGQRWYRAPEGPALLLRHTGCGHPFHPHLTCDRCQDAGRIRVTCSPPCPTSWSPR
jgi:DNA-binding HxlR family transcriptional regulator